MIEGFCKMVVDDLTFTLLAEAATGESDPETVVSAYFTAFQEQHEYVMYSDPLYPGVTLFKKDDTVYGYVVKRRGSKEEASREVGALRHLATLTDLILKAPRYLPLVNFGNIVLSPFVGPEVYMVEHQISEKLTEAVKNQDDETKEDMICFRRALVLRQLDILARAVVSPYIPKDEKGAEIISNRDIVSYYKSNMREVLTNMIKPSRQTHEQNTIDACLDFLTSNFLRDTSENRVRYVDTYSRNVCFRVTTGVPTQLLRVTLHDILQEREIKHQKYMNNTVFERDMRFLRFRLVQGDGHRNEKIALAGEMEANIIQAPRLLDCAAAPFDAVEQTNALCRFLLAKEVETACVDEKRRDDIPDIFEEIKKTESGKYSMNDLERVLTIDEGCREHYEAMSLYKALRWLGYVQKQYIPKYRNAPATDVTRERLALYEMDRHVYRDVALQAIDTLMDGLYRQIDDSLSSNRKRVTVNKGSRTHQYAVEKSDNGTFTCYSGIRGGIGKPIKTIDGFTYNIKFIDANAQTPAEKAYAGLLKLLYLKSIINPAE